MAFKREETLSLAEEVKVLSKITNRRIGCLGKLSTEDYSEYEEMIATLAGMAKDKRPPTLKIVGLIYRKFNILVPRSTIHDHILKKEQEQSVSS